MLSWTLVLGSTALALFVLYCYWPLTRFFFSQDDFHFLENASQGFGASMQPHFNAQPGHFRPITKGLYFLGMWPLFEMNPVPYHLVSLVLHIVNSILAGTLLRRFGASRAMSWIAAFLFAANVSNLEAIAWISCVQELLGTTFAFVALIWGIDALAARSRAPVIGASVAYLLALGSYEQTMAVPLVLILWRWSRHGWRSALRACRGPLLPMLWLLLVCSAYVLGIRELPSGGPYAMWIGPHVLENLRQYSGSVFGIWLIYPYLDLPIGWRGSHAVWLALAAWYLVRGKPRQLAFGGATFLLFLAPVLFMKYHVFSFHLYLPAIGAWYLLAGATDSLLDLLAWQWQRVVRVAAACAIILAAAGSTVAVRTNVTNYCSDDVRIPQLRVLRRAVLAEQVCADVAQRWRGGSRMALVYVGRQDVGNWGNIQSALGDGRALRLILSDPTLAVTMELPSDDSEVPTDQMMMVTELGETFTYRQYQAIMARQPSRP